MDGHVSPLISLQHSLLHIQGKFEFAASRTFSQSVTTTLLPTEHMVARPNPNPNPNPNQVSFDKGEKTQADSSLTTPRPSNKWNEETLHKLAFAQADTLFFSELGWGDAEARVPPWPATLHSWLAPRTLLAPPAAHPRLPASPRPRMPPPSLDGLPLPLGSARRRSTSRSASTRPASRA